MRSERACVLREQAYSESVRSDMGTHEACGVAWRVGMLVVGMLIVRGTAKNACIATAVVKSADMVMSVGGGGEISDPPPVSSSMGPPDVAHTVASSRPRMASRAERLVPSCQFLAATICAKVLTLCFRGT